VCLGVMLVTVLVGIDGRYVGVGGRQTVVTGSGVIMQVESNFTDPKVPVLEPFSRTAVVENLIIDGGGQGGTTGLLLENVGNAFVRNITIRNCDVGIKLCNTNGRWTEVNHLQHIRMENVKTGILFDTTGPGSDGPGDSFGHSFISGVGIVLRNVSDAVGIKVGDDPAASASKVAKPYFSFIKANVWLGSVGGCGVKLVNGELKHCLVNIGVHGHGTGIGLDLSTATANPLAGQTPIEKNQRDYNGTNIKGFLLYTKNVATPFNDPYGDTDVQQRSI